MAQTIDLSSRRAAAKFNAALARDPARMLPVIDASLDALETGGMFPDIRGKDEEYIGLERCCRAVRWALAALALEHFPAARQGRVIGLLRRIAFQHPADGAASYAFQLSEYGRARPNPAQEMLRGIGHYEFSPALTPQAHAALAGLLGDFVTVLRARRGDHFVPLRQVIDICYRQIAYRAPYGDAVAPYGETLQSILREATGESWHRIAEHICGGRLPSDICGALAETLGGLYSPVMAGYLGEALHDGRVPEAARRALCAGIAVDGSRVSMQAAAAALASPALDSASRALLCGYLAEIPGRHLLHVRPLAEQAKEEVKISCGRGEAYEMLEALEARLSHRLFVRGEYEADIGTLSAADRRRYAETMPRLYEASPARAFAAATRLLGANITKEELPASHVDTLYGILDRAYRDFTAADPASAALVVDAICSLAARGDAPLHLVVHFSEAIADAGARGISPAAVFYTANKIARSPEVSVKRRARMIEILGGLLRHPDAQVRAQAEAGRAQVAAEHLGLAHGSLLPENYFSDKGGPSLVLEKLPRARAAKPGPGA
jgi:hypothetical protein